MNEQIISQPMLNQKGKIFNEVAKSDWVQGKDTPMIRPTWIRKECYDYFVSDDDQIQANYETDREYDSTATDDEDKNQSKKKKRMLTLRPLIKCSQERMTMRRTPLPAPKLVE